MLRDPELDLLLDDHRRRLDAAYGDFVAGIEAAVGSEAPSFTAIWSAFADWFQQPLGGVAPADDIYEFYAGFIDGDPEREAMEMEAPEPLTPPLAMVELGRRFTVPHPTEAACSLGVGAAGVTFYYELTDDWRALASEPYWTNSNPLGWASHGTGDDRGASLARTETTIAHRLASGAYLLRAEVFSATRDDVVVLGPRVRATPDAGAPRTGVQDRRR